MEPPQEYQDLVRLVATLRAVEPHDPERRTVREQLLAKLAYYLDMPATIRGGRTATPSAA